jgi:hypothetical protein
MPLPRFEQRTSTIRANQFVVAVVEWCLLWENRRKNYVNAFQCHTVYHEAHVKECGFESKTPRREAIV